MEMLWKIRYFGTPRNPRFRVNKRRTACVITDEEGAQKYAEQLTRGQGVKVLSIKQTRR